MALHCSQIDNRWIALHVRSGWELKSARGLRDRGYEEFVPTYREKRQWSDRSKVVDVPLFMGYVFLRFDSTNRQPIVSTPGFINFVGVGPAPSPIEDGEIEALQIASRTNLQLAPCPFLEAGEPVFITAGPLKSLRGKVVRYKTIHRIIIDVSLLKMSAFVELDNTHVRTLPAEEGLQRSAA